MKGPLFLLLLLAFVSPGQNLATSADGSDVVVVGFKCARTHQTTKLAESGGISPVPEMTTANKYSARNARANDPRAGKDPTEDTIDGRSATMEKISQQARTAGPKSVDAYQYRVRVQN